MSEVEGARQLAADFASAAGRAVPDVARVVEVAAVKIKQGMQRDASASAHFRQIARSISYDLGLSGLSAEIGPVDDGGPGELANIAYIGTARGGGSLDLTGPLRAEAPVIEAMIERAVTGLGRG